MNPLWDQAFAVFGMTPSDKQRRQLETYTAELSEMNRKINLVKADSEEILLRQHLFDALAALSVLGTDGPPTAADAGSGCGIPGIPFAVFWPQTHFTLIERSEKRASFLRYVTAVCGLSDRICIENKDLSQIKTQFDCVVFRAFRQFDEFIRPLLSVTRTGGILAAFKGKEQNALSDASAAPPSLGHCRIQPLKNPFYNAERCLLLIRKN